MQTSLTQKCCETLRNSLKSDKANGLPDLAEYIASSRARRPLPDVLKTIVRDGISSKDLFDAVMKTQWLVLEHKLPEIMQLPPADQTLSLKEAIERFNHISETVLGLREQEFREEIEEKNKALAAEREARILTTAVQQWQKAGKIKLLNYYKGLPINSTVTVIEKSEGRHPSVTVQNSNDLRKVLAISLATMKNKSALSPDSDDLFLITMDVTDSNKDSVTFRANAGSLVERHSHLRLQPSEPVSIDVFRNKMPAGTGKIIDLSMHGLSVELASPDKQALNDGEIVSFCFPLGQDELKGSGWIRSVHNKEKYLKMNIEIMPDASLQRRLQMETASIQRVLIQEVRQKFSSFS